MRKLRNLPRLLMAALLLLLGIAQPVQAEVFCVNSVASLQTALTTAASNGVDDEVQIVQGTYVGNFVYASTQANKLSVLGGYTAGCAGRTLNPANTILNGNLTGTVLKVTAPDGAAEFLVEGLTLRKGKRTDGDGAGGGLYAVVSYSYGLVTLDSNIFIDNYGNGPGGGAYVGGNAIISGNTFTGNSGFAGGGISVVSVNSTTTVDNLFIGNKTWSGSGGGVYICCGGGHHVLKNNDVRNNEAIAAGGGVFLGLDNGTADVIGNIIVGNKANWSGGGLSLGARSSIINVLNNTIEGNSSGGDGGGLELGLAYYWQNTPSALFNNNILWQNRAVGNYDDISFRFDYYGGEAKPVIPVFLYNNNFDHQEALVHKSADVC